MPQIKTNLSDFSALSQRAQPQYQFTNPNQNQNQYQSQYQAQAQSNRQEPSAAAQQQSQANRAAQSFNCPDDFGFYPHIKSCDKYWACDNGNYNVIMNCRV